MKGKLIKNRVTDWDLTAFLHAGQSNRLWSTVTSVLFLLHKVILGLHFIEPSLSSHLQDSEVSILISFWGLPLRHHANLILYKHPVHLRTINNLFWSWSNRLMILWWCILPRQKQSCRELSGHWKISLISYLLWSSAFCIFIRKKEPADCHLNYMKIYLSFETPRHLKVL